MTPSGENATKPQLLVLAGVNGAGKSTYYRNRLKPLDIAFLNADELAAACGITDPQRARQLADELRDALIASRQTFAYETVFSHADRLQALTRAREQGYTSTLIFIHLANINLNIARVAQRVAEGGHHVASGKIRERLPRVLAHMKAAVKLSDKVLLLDNSSDQDPFREIAGIDNGIITPMVNPLPAWALDILF